MTVNACSTMSSPLNAALVRGPSIKILAQCQATGNRNREQKLAIGNRNPTSEILFLFPVPYSIVH